MTRFIAIASGKGGVGKTTTAINLGSALLHFGCESLVVDTDLNTPNVSLHLGSPIVPHTIHDSLRGSRSIRDVAFQHPSGLRIIPGSVAFDAVNSVNPDRLSDVLPQLYGAADVVLLDMAPGLGREAMASLHATDEAIIVTNPQPSSVADSLKAIKAAHQAHAKVLGIVVTRHVGDKYDMSLESIEKALGHPILAVIPEDPCVRKSHAAKHPVVHSHPESSSAHSYKRLAATLLGKEYAPAKSTAESASFYLKMLRSLGLG